MSNKFILTFLHWLLLKQKVYVTIPIGCLANFINSKVKFQRYTRTWPQDELVTRQYNKWPGW